MARLVRRPRWLAGTFLNILGWPLQTWALTLAPLAVVQPALAFGLVLLLVVGARRLGEPVGVREVGAVAGIAAGVALLTLVAPETSSRHAGTAALVAVLGAVGVVAVVPVALRRRGAWMTVSAGAALAWSGLSTKLVADALQSHDLVALGGWALATGLASGLGLLAEMTALRDRPATKVAPVVFVVMVVVPVLAAPLLVGERWHQPLLVLLGLGVVVGCAVALLAAPAVRAASSEETATERSPRVSSSRVSERTSAAVAAGEDAASTTTRSPAAVTAGSGAPADRRT